MLKTMIKVENLVKKFNGLTAVENISFEINEGEIFGFLGPNGAGKTTTIRMLSTLISPTSGNITVDGKSPKTDGEYIRSIIGILTETPGLYEKISGYDNLNFYSSFYNLPPKKRKDGIEKYLKMFSLWERKDDLAATYSKGMKQKLALARALIHEPKILYLDEPTSGLDPETAYMVRNYIEGLKKEKTTVFLCTHNLEEAQNLSDKVCIIKTKIITIASLTELQNSKAKRVEIILDDNAEKYKNLIVKLKEINIVEVLNNKIKITVREPLKINPVVIKILVDNGAKILYFNEVKTSLEEIYLDLINKE